MTKKKQKELKGFVDYPGSVFHVLDSKREALLLLMRQAIIQAGAPDFGDLLMREAVVAYKGTSQLLFVEVAQSSELDWIVFSIPLAHVEKFIGKGTFYTQGDATVRHYRAGMRYAIIKAEPSKRPLLFKGDSLKEL